MPRHALVSMLAMSLVVGLASLPAASLADDIKPKAPETAFSGKLRPDILGISTESNAESARAIFDSLFKGRTDTKTDIQQQKFGGASYVAALNFSLPAGSKQNGEMLSTSFSSPASANRAYFVARNLTFAPGPAAVEGRHDQGSHGQIRRAHHRRRSASVLHLPQGLDHVRRRQVQGSDRAGSDRQAARSAGPPSSSTAIPSAAVAWRSSSARRPRPRSRAPCWPRPRARTAMAC